MMIYRKRRAGEGTSTEAEVCSGKERRGMKVRSKKTGTQARLLRTELKMFRFSLGMTRTNSIRNESIKNSYVRYLWR